MNVTQRLLRVIQDQDLNINSIEKFTGSGSGTIRKAIGEGRDFKVSVLLAVSKLIPEVNLHWLITGLGSMYYEKPPTEETFGTFPGQSESLSYKDKYFNLLEKYSDLLEKMNKETVPANTIKM